MMSRKKHLLERINEREEYFSALSDEALSDSLRMLRSGSRDRMLINTFAAVREASFRLFGKRHYDVQILGGICLDDGCITEMQTGEGKTLAATCPAVLNALEGSKVHVITANQYLAERDFQEMGKLYAFLGFSTGLIIPGLTEDERRSAYACDIVYATGSELGFDYLRDNMLPENGSRVQQHLGFAIVDEADSVLIDDAKTPLIISAKGEGNPSVYVSMSQAVRNLQEGTDFERDKENGRIVVPTEAGLRKVEAALGESDLYSGEGTPLLNALNQSLKAYFVFQKDKDYVVRNGEVIIVDSFTGRIMPGRRYSDGLHQAIEAKEGISPKQESITVASITFQNYFRMYRKLAGMTGTGKTDEKEFFSIYGTPVEVIPPNRPSQRKDYPDVIFRTKKAKYAAVRDKAKECWRRGQPILIGTASIEASEEISSMLDDAGIPHNVLNAKHDALEASIIAKAGRFRAVTVATNMAGRGTDIATTCAAEDAGGLFVLGTEKHESRRIDNQLRGRTARQGAKGETQFYLSLEDDLFRMLGGEHLMETFRKYEDSTDDAPVESRLLTKAISNAQKHIEAKSFEIRRNLLEYDDVLDKQRKSVYEQREQIRTGSNDFILDNLNNLIGETAKVLLDKYADSRRYPEEWDLKGLSQAVDKNFGLQGTVTTEEMDGLLKDELDSLVIDRLRAIIELKKSILGKDTFAGMLRSALLHISDRAWTEQLERLSAVKEGIGLRAYGQQNPLYEYRDEAFETFTEMQKNIKLQFVSFALSMEIRYIAS